MNSAKHTREFRHSTVQLARNGEWSILKIAAGLDINSKRQLKIKISDSEQSVTFKIREKY